MRISIKTIILLSIILHSINSYAQQKLNNGFEQLSIEGMSRPWGWSIDMYSNTTVSLDSSSHHEGKYALKIFSEDTLPQQQQVSFSIETYALRNKTVILKGWIKTNDLQGDAYISAGYTAANDSVININSIAIKGTAEWQNVQLEIKLPDTVNQFYIATQYNGTGTAWYDDLSLIADGKKMEQAEVAEPFTDAQINWLSSVSYPLKKIDASPPADKINDDDLSAFKAIAGNAQIIALGEATHGTGEFFRLKHRILQYAVEELGVRIFAIEDNQLTVEGVNKYVMGGNGTARESMNGMFSVWQTEEVRDMIQWVRDYNDLHPQDKVEFTGFDMQSLWQPLDSLIAFAGRHSPVLAENIASDLSDMKQNAMNAYNINDSVKAEWFAWAELILEQMTKQKNNWLAASTTHKDSMQVYWGLQYANLVKQFAEHTYKGHISLYRDVAMAENISWILQMHKPGSKILIWAHNNHISRGDNTDNALNIYNGISMGAHLSKKYGDAYKSFGLMTYSGSYWAQVSYSDFRMMDCPLYDAPKGSLDEALHRVAEKKKADFLLLNLKNARTESWLTRPTPVRFANHVNIEYGYWTQFSVPYQFDGIFFIDTTTAAKSYAK